MNSEPVAISTAITTLVTAGLALATAFGMALSQAQQTAILGFVAAMILVAGLFVRSKVTPSKDAVSRDAAQNAINTAMLSAPGDPRPTLPE